MAYKDPEKQRAYKKAYREANPEKERARRKAYREANPEKERTYREANREKRRAYQKAYYEANRENRKAYREANREKIQAREKTYCEANREKRRAYSRTKRTGWTPEAFEAAWERQGGRCDICKHAMTRGGKNKYSVAADHCHKTNEPRALLCDLCNKGIGCLGDDPDRLEEASRYIRRYMPLPTSPAKLTLLQRAKKRVA